MRKPDEAELQLMGRDQENLPEEINLEYCNQNSKIWRNKAEESTVFFFNYDTKDGHESLNWEVLRKLKLAKKWGVIRHPYILNYVNQKLIDCAFFYTIHIAAFLTFFLLLASHIFSRNIYTDWIITIFVFVFSMSLILKGTIKAIYKRKLDTQALRRQKEHKDGAGAPEPSAFSKWFVISVVFNVLTYSATLAYIWLPTVFAYDDYHEEQKKIITWFLPIIAIVSAWSNLLYIIRKSPFGIYIFMMTRILKSFGHAAYNVSSPTGPITAHTSTFPAEDESQHDRAHYGNSRAVSSNGKWNALNFFETFMMNPVTYEAFDPETLAVAVIWIPTLITFSFAFLLIMRDTGVKPWPLIDQQAGNMTMVHTMLVILQAITKTSTMMIGEVDANDILDTNQWIPSILVLVFEIITVILLMNLMVSLAVGDVNYLKNTANDKLLKIKVNFVIEALQLSELDPFNKISKLHNEKENKTHGVLVIYDDGSYFTKEGEFPKERTETCGMFKVRMAETGANLRIRTLSGRVKTGEIRNCDIDCVETSVSGIPVLGNEQKGNFSINDGIAYSYSKYLIGLNLAEYLDL